MVFIKWCFLPLITLFTDTLFVSSADTQTFGVCRFLRRQGTGATLKLMHGFIYFSLNTSGLRLLFQEFGLSLLQVGATGMNLRSMLCALLLLCYYTFLTVILGTGGLHLYMQTFILSFPLELQTSHDLLLSAVMAGKREQV